MRPLLRNILACTATSLLAICGIFTCTTAQEQAFSKAVHFADQHAAIDLLLTEDAFTQRWSAFDIASRLGVQDGAREDLFSLLRSEARAWTDGEKEALLELIREIDADISGQHLSLPFPDTIFIVKTTGAEEGGAPAYTRRHYIVVSETLLASLPHYRDGVKGILIHELFHILSRNNDDFRRSMYAAIGFHACNNVPYPADLEDLRITNPDAPLNNSYITLRHEDDELHCMMILYASKPYEGGSFFQYITSGLLVVDEVAGEMRARQADGEPVIYQIKDIPDFFAQVGRNTNYIIHPEEILADNFRFVVTGHTDVASPEIVERMTVALVR